MLADDAGSGVDDYAIFAGIYDEWQRLFGEEYALLVAPLVNARFASRAGSVRTLIDLACGTGTFALLQARAGVRVTGVDLSHSMLCQARRKARARALPVELLQADMREFDVTKPVDAVTCLYSSLGHLDTFEGVRAAFGRVRAHLRPGGAFVFDLNTPAGFEALWREPVTERGADFTVRRAFEVDPGGLWTTMRMTIDLRREGLPRRLSTSIRARWFSTEEVRAALADAGLQVVDTLDFNPFTDVAGHDLKQLWTAVRPR